MIVGIDYSLSCPSICFQNPKGITEIHYVTSTKTVQDTYKSKNYRFVGHAYPTYHNDQDRYNALSEIFIGPILDNKITSAVFEGYSMGSKGRVFNIAENAAVLKHKLYLCGVTVSDYAPTVIKKYAGKGNFDKFEMYQAWYAKTGINLYDLFGLKESKSKVPSPIQDIVDSFFVYDFAQSLRNSKSLS